MKFDAVIFDMDGVLVDTENFYDSRRKKFFAEKGISTSHLPLNFFTGGQMSQMWPEILRDKYQKSWADQLQSDYLQLKVNLPIPYKELLFPGVRELLNDLKSQGLKIGLASSSSFEEINRNLTENKLAAYFDAVLTGEDFLETKPNPEIYHTAMAKLSVAADKTLVIEDSERGIAAGKASGATVWAIHDSKFGLDQSAADEIFENLEAIQAKLDKA